MSGPEDLAPPEYFWGYNKMTTLRGLFVAGDGVGAAPHKFSSGSFTEGRLAAKAAVRYVLDHPEASAPDQNAVERLQRTIWAPLETFEQYRGVSTAGGEPHCLTPKQGLVRLQKIMDEYAAGTSAWYTTNGPTLQRGLELIEMLRTDLQHLAARNLHELLRCWELWHRVWVGSPMYGACSSARRPAGWLLLSCRLPRSGRDQLAGALLTPVTTPTTAGSC